jgi:hypothetical protein
MAGRFAENLDDGLILYFDIDRHGVIREPQDLLRFRRMLSGSGPATRSWMAA